MYTQHHQSSMIQEKIPMHENKVLCIIFRNDRNFCLQHILLNFGLMILTFQFLFILKVFNSFRLRDLKNWLRICNFFKFFSVYVVVMIVIYQFHNFIYFIDRINKNKTSDMNSPQTFHDISHWFEFVRIFNYLRKFFVYSF